MPRGVYDRKAKPLLADELKAKIRERNQSRKKQTREWLRLRRATPDGWLKMALVGAKHRAKRLGLRFNLTEDDVHVPNICPVLGIELRFGQVGRLARNYNSPSLDRVNNRLGYVRGNVKVVSARANILKNDGTIEELEGILRYMKQELL